MKKIFAYFGFVLSIALLGVFTACNPKEIDEQAEVGLGIKTFFPTKVVAGQPMTISGTGMADVREVVFPEGVSVSNIEHVGNGMIRVTAPSGIASAGGKLIVRTSDDQAESSQDLTLGHTVISGFSKLDGEEINGGEQLTIFGTDLEFISGAELLDPDGNPLYLDDADFYRKGTSSVIITIPKKIFEGTWTGKLFTFDGRELPLPELTYVPASDGGHWETVKTVIWTNEDGSAVSWSSKYRFAPDFNSTGEEIYTVPADVWAQMKTTTFYVTIQGENPQIRVTTGWWGAKLTDDDIQPGNELLTDNGDGTWTLRIDLDGTALVNDIDSQHLLFTGDRFTPIDMYFEEEIWVDGGGHWETVKDPVWTNELGKAVSWSSDYRFAPEFNSTGEEIYTVPADVWEKMKTTTFYVTIQGENPQIRVTTGWWGAKLTDDDIQPGNELLTDNGDGTWKLKVDLAGTALCDDIDAQHLLFTGDRFTPLEIYFEEEIWVDGGDSGPKEVDIWVNELGKAVSWSSDYRFATEFNATGEEIVVIPADTWAKMKTTTFYLLISSENPQVRITTGWWGSKLTNDDIQPGNELMVDNGDGTWTITINLSGTALGDDIDAQHLLFTGDRFTPVKMFFLE